jgi:hypothetical protein
MKLEGTRLRKAQEKLDNMNRGISQSTLRESLKHRPLGWNPHQYQGGKTKGLLHPPYITSERTRSSFIFDFSVFELGPCLVWLQCRHRWNGIEAWCGKSRRCIAAGRPTGKLRRSPYWNSPEAWCDKSPSLHLTVVLCYRGIRTLPAGRPKRRLRR